MAARKSRKSRQRRSAQAPFRPILEPLEARVLPTCTTFASVLAVSTHLVGDYSQAAMTATVKPLVLVEHTDAAGGMRVQSELLSTLLHAAGPDRALVPQLCAAPQGPQAYQAALASLGLPAGTANVDVYMPASSPMPGGACGGGPLPVDTPPIPATCPSGSGGNSAGVNSFSASSASGAGVGPLWYAPNRLHGGSGGSAAPLPWAVPNRLNGGFGAGLNELAGYSENTFNLDPGVSLTAAPVRYFDGTVRLDMTDLSSDGFGTPFGVTRSWTNGTGYATFNYAGNNTVLAQMPYLIKTNVTSNSYTIIQVSNGVNVRYFDFSAQFGDEGEHWYLADYMGYGPPGSPYVFTDPAGNVMNFYDFSSSVPASEQGKLKNYTDRYGNVINVLGYTSFGAPTEIQRSNTTNGVTITESLLYTYNAGAQLTNVTLRRQTNGGAWTTIRQVSYTYYDGILAYGNAGDLQYARIEDAAGNVLDTKYYRYYTGEAGGYVGGLKYLFNPDSYARLVAAVGDPTTASDAQVAPYADNYFEYDALQRVSKEVVQGAGSSGGTGQGTYAYSYAKSSFTPNGNLNVWVYKTVETLPDGNQNIVYCNYAGEVMLKVYHDMGMNQNWITFYKYDGSGRVLLTAYPSAVTGYDETTPDLLHNVNGNYQYLADTTGLIALTDYYASGGSQPAGYVQDTKVQQGELGTPVLQETDTYTSQTANGITVYPLASQTLYHNADGTGAVALTLSYTWYANTVQVQSVTATYPAIAAGEDGPGTADTETAAYDQYGRETSFTDGAGVVTATAYDQATGAVTQTITDVNGLHLVTAYTVDGLGRTTKEVTPAGNVSYIVYDDVNHAVRVYAGWNSGTNTPTGPTVVYREDRSATTGYTETLTMSAAPHVTNGAPDGTEAISNLQSLSRTYTSAGGQVVRQDDYFNLNGLTYSAALYIGTAGTNYYSTLFGYNADGRPNRTQQPTGTIERDVIDGMGRLEGSWVGTNDTGATDGDPTGGHAAGNNMVQVSGYVYDNGNVGDDDLTQETDSPGGTAANRVTQLYYDWRDRLVATKAGVQTNEDTSTHRPILYADLNNWGQATDVSQFDGDGVTVTFSNGVPNKPAASLLRAYSTAAYDDQGRVYATNTYSVDQSNGTVSTTSLATNDYYDHRGYLVATSAPGGLWTKQQLDGAGRLTVTYATDGAGGTTWAAATTAANDTVLEQQEQQYDADGNVIESIDRQRFDSATGLGPLGSPTSGIGARVYYTATYYDLADRPTWTSAPTAARPGRGPAPCRPARTPCSSPAMPTTPPAWSPT